MKTIFKMMLITIMLFSCSNEQTEEFAIADAKANLNTTVQSSIPIDGMRLDTIGYKDPAVHNKRKIMFRPTLSEGTAEEILESMVIVSAHAKAVSFNWDFSNGENDFSDENRAIFRVVLLNEQGQWLSQTFTSGWRGMWTAYLCEPNQNYTLWFQYTDSDGDGDGARVEFIMPDGKI
jgi:hypothetical protein